MFKSALRQKSINYWDLTDAQHWMTDPSLPFIEAIYLETLRWHPAVPLGMSLIARFYIC